EGSLILIPRFLGRTADRALELERVCVENRNVVFHDVGDVKQPILRIESDAARSFQRLGTESGNQAVRRVEYEDGAQMRIADEQAIVVVNRQADDLFEVDLFAVVNE